jgi:hypothetical protein
LGDFKVRAQEWIDKYHSSNLAINQQIAVYKKILGE